MNPTTIWDRPATNRELDSFYGREIDRTAADEIHEVLTESIRKVDPERLTVPVISYRPIPQEVGMKLSEVITDYTGHHKPMNALFAVLARSDCPLVAAYRKELADCYAYYNADEIDLFRAGEV